MPPLSKQAAHWLAVCRAFAPGGDKGLVKAAELGGDGRDGQFEQAFSNLAHAFLKDKAPSLLDYEVGFQLMERNDENTKAVGVFGFKVGPQWLYAPMFFISGDLKGHELLYIKAQDQFVPLKENWLNYLLQRRPNVLGRDVQPNLQQLGVLGPDLQAFSRSPTKFGSHVKVADAQIPADMVPGMAAFAHFARTNPLADPKYTGVTDLPTFLKKEGAAVIGAVVRMVESYPRLAGAFEAHYGGVEVIGEAIKTAADLQRRRRHVLEKEGLNSFEFGRHPADQRGNRPSIYNGGQASTGLDAFRSLDRVTRKDGSGWTPDEFHKKAFPAQPAGGGLLDPTTTPPPPAGGGVLGAPRLGPAGPSHPGPPPAALPTAPAPSPVPEPEPEPAPVTPQPTRVQQLMSGIQGLGTRANGWLDQNASWIPAGLPGGRATAAMLGIGGLAGVAGAFAGSRRKKTRDELLAEALAKEGEASNFQRRGPKGPFEMLVESTPGTKKKKPKGGLPDPSGVLAKMAEDDEKVDVDLEPAAAGDNDAVAVVTMETVSQRGVFLGVTDEEKETVKADGFAIRDKRPESSVAYEVQTELKLGNPHETGIYDVLTSPGKFEQCLIVLGPQSGDGKKPFCTIVATSGGKKWLNVHPSVVWTRQDEVSPDEYRKWFEKQPEVTTLKASYTGVYMLVGPDGSATVPFEVREADGGDDAVKTYKVYFRDYAERSRASGMPPVETREPYWGYGMDSGFGDGCCSMGGEDAIHLTNKAGGKLKAMNGQLYVPGGYRLLTLKADQDKDDERPRNYYGYRSDPSPIALGKLVDIERAIYEKTAALKLTHTGSVVTVNGHPMHPDYAVVHLVRDWGLREKQARACLKHARADRAVNYRVDLLPGLPPDPAASHVSDLRVIDRFMKLAAGEPIDPTMFGGSTSPSFPAPPTGMEPTLTGGVSAQYPQSEELPVYTSPDPSGSAAMMDPRMPPQPDPYASGAAMQAAQTGQREVFDTAMVGGLLKAVRDDTMVDRYLGDMMKGLDRIGRVLFSFYWHGEEFQDRYGKKDMPELEDSLRNAFEQVGDVVLFLKQKTVEPFQDETSNVDLGATAEV